ncbi:MAG: tetratricopeptide repeat protein [Verrucomicrobiia bacterium]
MPRLVALVALLFGIAYFGWVPTSALAQARTSPQDQYLQIYLAIQDAERTENSGQKATARGRYQSSLTQLKDLQKANPEWEPTIVRYRIKFLEDKLSALEGASDAQPSSAPTPSVAAPVLPADPEPEPVESSVPPAPVPTTATIDPEPVAESPPPPAPAPVEALPPPPAPDHSAETAKLQARITELETELAETKGKLASAEAEATKLREQISSLQSELAEVKKASAAGTDQMNTLLEENKALMAKLAEANAEIEKLKVGEKGSVANLEMQLKKSRDQLTMTKNENEALLKANEEFRKNLQELQQTLAENAKQLEEARKQAPAPAAAANAPLQKENEVLRNIVERQLKEQARRDAAQRLALEEIQRLNVQSETLATQLQILGSPLVKLSEEELALLKLTQPTVQSPEAPASAPAQPPTVQIDQPSGSISAEIPQMAGFDKRPRVPEAFRSVAAEAQKLFAQQRFDEAAAKYQTILNAHPDSLYALSNLAVVRFQQANYPEAEKFLRRCVELSPQDAFSHSILGIVLYQQGKFDDAVTVLTRAVALDPKDPKTRNYLGIAASQKGMQESAEQQCRKAIELDETYGDAHFNLAVIYATQTPPAKELARRHYRRALELGVPRDDSLEAMIR